MDAAKQRGEDDDLSRWLAGGERAEDTGPGSIADVRQVRALRLDAALEGRAVSYIELLLALGQRFTRPKMRALCRTLDAIDSEGAAAGEPGLAVLVVRESDRLPGQGGWIEAAQRDGYAGAWTGADAASFVRDQQRTAFSYWRVRARPFR